MASQSCRTKQRVAWNNLGTLLLGKGETEKAKACYRKAVELGSTMAAPLAR
jgi:Flp pilus assembly protein TadD